MLVIAALTYTLARISLLAGMYAIGYVLGLRDLTLLIVAFLTSGLLSFLLLNKQRNAMGLGVANFFSRINQKIDENTRKEDNDA